MKVGRWKELKGNYMTPGGTPVFVCANCGGSEHLHGVEYPQRRVFCSHCGSVNVYPWEKIYDMETPSEDELVEVPESGLLICGTAEEINNVLHTINPDFPVQNFENAGRVCNYRFGETWVTLHVRQKAEQENKT